MGWNGSDREKVEVEGRGRQRRDRDRCAARTASAPYRLGAATSSRSPYRRGLIAGAIIVAVGCGAIWWFGRGRTSASPQVTRDTTKTARIAEQSPSVPAASSASAVPEKPNYAVELQKKYPHLRIPKDWDKPYPPEAYRADGSLKKYSRYVHVNRRKRSKASMSVAEYTFENPSEQTLASILIATPGNEVVGDFTYTDEFVEDLRKCIDKPIEDAEDDTPFQRELRQSVREMKKEFKERLARGEDVVQLLNDTRKELVELSLYREDLKRQVQQLTADGEMSEKDQADLINAANLMLEERGVKPLRMPEALIENLKLDKPDENGDSAETNEKNQLSKEFSGGLVLIARTTERHGRNSGSGMGWRKQPFRFYNRHNATLHDVSDLSTFSARPHLSFSRHFSRDCRKCSNRSRVITKRVAGCPVCAVPQTALHKPQRGRFELFRQITREPWGDNRFVRVGKVLKSTAMRRGRDMVGDIRGLLSQTASDAVVLSVCFRGYQKTNRSSTKNLKEPKNPEH